MIRQCNAVQPVFYDGILTNEPFKSNMLDIEDV